jgi:hypothetical protein
VASVRRYLVVGNQTLGSARLLREMRSCASRGPAQFHLIVPPTEKPHGHASSSESEARASCQKRLDAALVDFTTAAFAVDGEVCDHNVVDAVSGALEREGYDEIILSTLPPGLSRWIHADLAHRLKRRFQLPVRHVVVPFEDLAPPAS